MNKITCICLGARNMEKALRFYRDGLRFQSGRLGRRFYQNPDEAAIKYCFEMEGDR